MQRVNDRHPWSHNDAFHPWITTRLPARRGTALDVGCGRGELLALLAQHFDLIRGIDVDADMRRVSAARCAGLSNVTVESLTLDAVPPGADLVTMIAVLHHLDLEPALEQVRRILNPGGRFLCVGLARPDSVADHAWDLASMATNPIIGYVRHPWPAEQTSDAAAPFPVRDPTLTFAQLRAAVEHVLPGAAMQRHLGFRHTIAWTKPPGASLSSVE
nr:class I SAM-dependent methyltransferase [Flexivirga oryzae]